MSKRKDIELIHQVKGISYGEARRLYKENGEDINKVLGLDKALELLNPIIPDLTKAIDTIVNAITEFINNIEWDKFLEACNKTLDEVNKEELYNEKKRIL